MSGRGVCALRRLCPVRAIYQMEPLEAPSIDWGRCHACAKCVEAWPLKAISLVN